MKQSHIPDKVDNIPAYDEGRKAQANGKARLNPHRSGLREAAWYDGWDDEKQNEKVRRVLADALDKRLP